MDFAKLEEAIRAEWQQKGVQEIIKQNRSDSCKEFKFLDGPPFCNGKVHSGHILVSTIKDTMARYKSQQGYKITYQLGFDSHGLPIESEAEKTVGKVSPTDSLEKIQKFNNRCREIIANCSDSWFSTLGQLGRQFDRDQTYYTCSFDYMRHLWAAFKQLYDQDLIYMSKKVMPYSGPCETPLSNFEASSNYKDRTDISVYVAFKLKDIKHQEQYIVIWTTTPWSLLANQGICVNPELIYTLVELEGSDKQYWISQNSINKLFDPQKCKIVAMTPGRTLANLEYEPIYNNSTIPYKLYADSYVKDDTGTGAVHLAPLFGEDDYRVMKLQAEQIPEHIVDSQLRFKVDELVNDTTIKGRFVIDTALDITIGLKKTGQVLKSEKITHSYPHCWRTDVPLVYLACDAWFINVQRIIPELLENNSKINWYPKYVGTERFANWIRSAPDWCISRNRVWGTPIPIWTSPSGKTKCVGTVEELEALTGQTITDLHLDHIYSLEFDYEGERYKRTFGVLDCWFESGMAPTARYPYISGKTLNSSDTDVEFISESLDQTRGWFYTLNVLSTALYHKPAYNNVIVSGLILAEDGKKMSKRLKNYTDPLDVMNKYGSDVLRMYLLGSPSTKAESFCFKDKDLGDISRKINTYANAISLYKDSLVMYGEPLEAVEKPNSQNNLDIWIYNIFHNLRNTIYKHLESLELMPIPNLIYKYIDQLCNTYIKLSRDRLKSQSTREDSIESLQTLGYVLKQTNILLVPFMPHLSEHFHRELSQTTIATSIHLEYIDIHRQVYVDSTILDSVYSLGEVFETVRNLRVKLNTPILYPLENIVIYTDNFGLLAYEDVIKKELNIKGLSVKSLDSLQKKYLPNKGTLGKLFKARASEMAKYIEEGLIEQPFLTRECYNIEYVLEELEGMISAKFDYYVDDKQHEGVIYLANSLTDSNKIEAEVNNIRRQINILRKEFGFKLYDKVAIEFLRNKFLDNLDIHLFNSLTTQLGGNVLVSDTVELQHNTIKSLDSSMEFILTINKC
jgi:isoleucyl-tRNA synthetase